MLSRRHLLGLAAAPALLAGCSENPSTTSDVGFAGGDGSFSRIAVDKRTKAPTISGTDLDGKPLSTADHLGTVLVLNVWGSWCAPCRKEAPDLVKAAGALAGTAQILGICTRDLSVDPARAFVRAFKVPYRNFFDPDGSLLLDLAALPPNAIPSTVILDKQGRIAARVTGATTATTLVQAAQDVAAGR